MTKDQIITNYIRWILPQFRYKTYIDRDAYFYDHIEMVKVYQHGMEFTDNFHEEIQKFLPFWEGEVSSLMKIVKEMLPNNKKERAWHVEELLKFII